MFDGPLKMLYKKRLGSIGSKGHDSSIPSIGCQKRVSLKRIPPPNSIPTMKISIGRKESLGSIPFNDVIAVEADKCVIGVVGTALVADVVTNSLGPSCIIHAFVLGKLGQGLHQNIEKIKNAACERAIINQCAYAPAHFMSIHSIFWGWGRVCQKWNTGK